MVQLAAIMEKPRKCRACGRKNPISYLEVEGAIVVILRSKPYPFGGTIFIHRGIFCDMDCYQKYIRKMYDEGIKGREGKLGWRKEA